MVAPVHTFRSSAQTHEPARDGLSGRYIWGQHVDELIQQREYGTCADCGSGGSGSENDQPFHDLYPLADLHYRNVALTHSSRAVVEAYDYDAYGNTLIYACSGPDGFWFTHDDQLLPPPGISEGVGYHYLGKQGAEFRTPVPEARPPDLGPARHGSARCGG